MYKSAQRFLDRLPATRFWQEYAPIHHLKLVNSDEVLLDALADAVGRAGSRISMDSFKDYELAGLLVVTSNRGLIDGIASRVAAEVDRRLETEAEDISFSESQRTLIAGAIKSAATNWRHKR